VAAPPEASAPGAVARLFRKREAAVPTNLTISSSVSAWPRLIAIGVAGLSAAAMLYVGLYQARVIPHMVCPITGYGCRTVADAPFARPFGIPDGYLGAGLYGLILLLLLIPAQGRGTWLTLLGLAGLATLANILGVRDMMNLGAFCFYCLLTTILSPVLLGAIWVSR
jgi:uncharacterized membrane protein